MILVMEDIKLPDLSKLRDGRKRSKKLPTQTSPQDTSNWDDRAFSAPSVSVDRELMFRLDNLEDVYIAENPLLEQERAKSIIRKKKK